MVVELINNHFISVQYSKIDECKSYILFHVKTTINKFWNDAEMLMKSFWTSHLQMLNGLEPLFYNWTCRWKGILKGVDETHQRSVNFKMSFWFHGLDKITNEIISEFLPWNFLYLPGGFLQASLFMILHTKSPGSQKSFHEAPRKLQKNSGQKSRNDFVGIFVQTMKPKGHFEINWPLLIVSSRCCVNNCVLWLSTCNSISPAYE